MIPEVPRRISATSPVETERFVRKGSSGLLLVVSDLPLVGRGEGLVEAGTSSLFLVTVSTLLRNGP